MSDQNLELIGFKISGDWTVDEWTTLLNSLAKIYNVFLSAKIAKDFETNTPDSFKYHLPELTASQVLQNMQDYDEGPKLRVYRAKMASPGGLSFSGSGEVIRELRIFIRHLYMDIIIVIPMMKTRHQILKAILNAVQMSPESNTIATILTTILTHPGEKEALKTLVEAIFNINQLASTGKLESIAENIDYVPE